MLIAALFRVAKNGEQVYSSADRWINKLQSIHGTEYFQLWKTATTDVRTDESLMYYAT